VSGDHTITGHDLLGHPEVTASMRHERICLFESAGIEQKGDALAGRQLTGFSLASKALLAAAGFGLTPHVGQLRQRISSRVHA
jgi:hypothetical protein